MVAPPVVEQPWLPSLLVLSRLAIAAAVALDPGRPTVTAPLTTTRTIVLSVGDGDTLRVDDRGKRLTIRLACIDAPELTQGPYGQQSRALLASLAPVGADVTLKVVDTDRYGRTVAEISRGEQNVNLRMVRRGQAFAYRQYLSNCNPAAYLGAERGAETDRLGVWSVPGGIQRPWTFRDRHFESSTWPEPAWKKRRNSFD
jgi:endonuclease YncB( thermonuclease family)